MHRTSRLLAALLVAGCTSYGATNSPVTDQNGVEVPDLLGRWRIADFVEGPACLVIAPLVQRTYHARLDECDSLPKSSLRAEFTRLGGELFAVAQTEITDTAVNLGEEVLALYSFYRVRTRNDSLFVGELNAFSLRTYLVAHPAEIPFVLLEGNGPDVLLTATTEQLAEFLAAHARDTTFWASDSAPEGWWARVH